MAGIDQNTLWQLASMILGKPKAQPTTRERATFLRTDPDGTQWVRLPSSNDETPVNGRTLATAKAGDTVEWSIDDGRLSITGNESQPSVGMREVFQTASDIVQPVIERVSKVNELAALSKNVADAAQRVADAVNQHFFSDTNGVHVTEATQEDWNENHEGANVLLNAAGQLFRDGLVNLLTLTTESGARVLTVWDGLGNTASHIRAIIGEVITLGPLGSVQMILSSAGLEIDNEAGNTIFAVESNSTGTTTVTVMATAATWAAETDVDTTTYAVVDASAASGYAVVTATIADTDYTLDSTYATATVTAGTGASVALTLDGVDYVRSLMTDAGVTAGTLSVEYQRTVADSASLTFDGSQVVNGSGRAIALLNGVSGTETFFDAHNTVTNARVLFGVGAGGYNRGIWDVLASSWIIYRTQSGKTVIVGPNFSVSSEGRVSSTYQVSVKGTGSTSSTRKVIALRSNSAGNRGLYDVTNDEWIIFRNASNGELYIGSGADPIHHYTDTCTVNTTNATVYNNVNHCCHNNAAATVTICVNLKSSLASGSTVSVATAPENYRPPFNVIGSVYVTGATASAMAVIGTGGGIMLNNRSGSAIPTSANIYASFTFAL